MLRLLGTRATRTDVDLDTTPIINIAADDDSDVSLLVADDDNTTHLVDITTDSTDRDIVTPSQPLVVVDPNELNPTCATTDPLPTLPLPAVTVSHSVVAVSALPPPSLASNLCEVVSVRSSGAALGTPRDATCRRSSRHGSSHHRSSSSRRRQRLCRFKRKESNYMAATCNMVVIVLMCIAMFEPRWFYVRGGHCSDTQRTEIDYLGIKMFLYDGDGYGYTGHQQNAYYYGSSQQEVLVDCVTPSITFIMKTIIVLCFVVIIFSFVACLMDLFGPTHVVFKAVRCTGSLSILSVSLCVTVTGLCYLVTEQLTSYYASHRLHETSRIDVEFDVGFYMITAAGAVSVIAVACTLMHNRHRHSSSSSSRRRSSWLRSTPATFDPTEPDDAAVSQLRRERWGDVATAAPAVSACTEASRSPPPYRP